MKNLLCRGAAGIAASVFFVFAPAFGQNPDANVSGASAALHQRTLAAHAIWRQLDGEGFRSVIGIANGKPTLMLTMFKDQPAEEDQRQKLAILSALEFLLDADAFDQARIIVATHSAKRFSDVSFIQLEIGRNQFRSAATSIAKTQTAKDAISKARRDGAVLMQIYTQLGFR